MDHHDEQAQPAPADFFISYTHADRKWAEWIAWQIEADGFRVILQDWDFPAGANFVRRMDDASRKAKQTLLVLSKAYLTSSEFGFAEWAAAFRSDPTGERRRVIPVRIEDIARDGLLGQINTIDLFDCGSSVAATERLRDRLGGKRAKPTQAPTFPGHEGSGGSLQDYPPLESAGPELVGGDDELFSVTFSRDGRWLAAGSNGYVLLWDREHLESPRRLEGADSYIYSVAFSPDSRLLVGGSEDKAVRLWDVQTGQLQWSPAADGSGPRQRHGDAVYSVAFSPDGRRVVSGGYDRRVNLWDTASGRLDAQQCRELDSLGRVTSVAFAPQGAPRIAIGSLDNRVRLWHLESDDVEVLTEHASSVESIAFSRDGNLLASCGLDKTVRIWSIPERRQLWSKTQHEYLVRSVAFSPDGTTVASASWDKTLRLWDATTGKHRRMMPLGQHDRPWHTDWIWSAAFSPDGRVLATSGSDSKVLLWKVGG